MGVIVLAMSMGHVKLARTATVWRVEGLERGQGQLIRNEGIVGRERGRKKARPGKAVGVSRARSGGEASQERQQRAGRPEVRSETGSRKVHGSRAEKSERVRTDAFPLEKRWRVDFSG